LDLTIGLEDQAIGSAGARKTTRLPETHGIGLRRCKRDTGQSLTVIA